MFDKLKKALGVDEEEEDYEGEDFPSFVSRGDDGSENTPIPQPEHFPTQLIFVPMDRSGKTQKGLVSRVFSFVEQPSNFQNPVFYAG